MRALLLHLLLAFTFSLFSQRTFTAGYYRGVLALQPGGVADLPFLFRVHKGGKQLTIFNGEEKIIVKKITRKGDSVNFRMPVFDTEFRTKLTSQGLQGVWINHYRKSQSVIPFSARFNKTSRFDEGGKGSEPSAEGRWQCTFGSDTADLEKAVGIFHHVEQTQMVTGTFLTETGDYRFLEGVLRNDTLLLSAFDGSHAFLFQSLQTGDSLTRGMFWSGSHFQEPWKARRDPSFQLRDPNSITTVTDSTGIMNFSFRNTKGRVISLNDKRYRNKPVIVQLMGTWCPNCLDECRYLSELYKRKKRMGLEIIALSFEKTSDTKVIKKRLARFSNAVDVEYEILMTNNVGKDEATKAIAKLDKIYAFPTTIFLDREHRVRRVHTGFSGPATGAAYEQFKQQTENLIDNLLR